MVMSTGQFIIDFMESYSSILSAMLWPVVALIMFFTLIYYLERTIGTFTKKKQPQITWKNLEYLVQRLEDHRSTVINSDASTKRQHLLRNELSAARKALNERDEKKIMRSLLSLSILAQHSDRSLSSLNIDEDKASEEVTAEVILPGEYTNYK